MYALRILVLLAALIGSVWLGGGLIYHALWPDRADWQPSAQGAAIGERIMLVPEHAAFYSLLRQEYPQDFARILETLAKREDTPKADPRDAWFADALRLVRQTHGIAAARASLPRLDRVFEAQAKMMAALSDADPRLCVDFLYGHATQAFFDFAATRRALVADIAIAGLEAMIEGRAASPESRRPPTDDDFAGLERALLERGLSRASIDALLDGKTPDPPISDSSLCRSGRIYVQTLRALPEDVRLRIYALAVELLARS